MFNMGKMMKQAQEMQGRLKEARAELEKMERSYTAGGAITVTARGDYSITGIKISPEAIDPEDVEGLEDLMQTAVNGALEEVKRETKEKMSALTGGMDMEGLM